MHQKNCLAWKIKLSPRYFFKWAQVCGRNHKFAVTIYFKIYATFLVLNFITNFKQYDSDLAYLLQDWSQSKIHRKIWNSNASRNTIITKRKNENFSISLLHNPSKILVCTILLGDIKSDAISVKMRKVGVIHRKKEIKTGRKTKHKQHCTNVMRYRFYLYCLVHMYVHISNDVCIKGCRW